ncbi:E3 SUMO-protein ligase ZBED1-like [Haliotis rubra]|uniref:E3 SUMO-protein ligase ZBED1-like n=1 Tax=Haliotis rubra TaxID=36100 RepID=UPI001EE5359F|nr:E3 SUMO-protein ligase ZBED1-like [Haliotis rubra]
MFIARDLRPCSTVENDSFVELLRVLEPKYNVPGRTYFTGKVVPELYKECKMEVENGLRKATAVAITTDGWTSRAPESYITVPCHYISGDWKLVNNVLQTNAIYESHTGANVGEILSDAVKEWKLERSEPVVCVTDNAANMTVAVKEAGLKHVKCFAHTINLASQKGLKVDTVFRVLSKVRRIVGFFHRSSTATALLREKQKMLQLPEHKLIQDVCTRWNSSFDMIDRFIEQQPAILAVLMSKQVRKPEKDLGLSDTELCNAEDLVGILKPMKTITTILCDEKHPTISLIFPLKEKILNMTQAAETDSAFIRSVKTAISEDISKRYIDGQDLLLQASAMDPRFRSLPHVDDARRLAVFGAIIAKTAALADSDSGKVEVKTEIDEASGSMEPEDGLPQLPEASDLKQSVTPDVKEENTSAMDDLFGDVFVTHVQTAKSSYARVEEEVSTYKAEDCIPLNSDPLQWWQENEETFPLLSKLARCILCVPGTSVPSERVFSTAGDIVTAQRATLRPENVNMLIFLKKNLKK